MFQPNYTQIPPEIVGELHPLLVSQTPKIANPRIDKSTTGTTWLVIPFNEPNQNFAILVEISQERLKAIKNRSMKLIFPFKQPEKQLFFLAQYNTENKIEKLAYLYPDQRKFEWPIPDSIDFGLKFIEKTEKDSLLQYASKRNRCAIEMTFESDELQDNLRVWSFKNVLLPCVEMVKSAILSNNIQVNAKNLESKLKFGLTKIQHKCISFTCEFAKDALPELNNQILENIENMHHMLDANLEEDMIANADTFDNKKLATDMIKVFRSIIAHKAVFKSRFATPEHEFKEIILNRPNAEKRKKWLETKVSKAPYLKEVVASLTMIKAGKHKKPLFAIDAIDDEEKSYFGKICPEIAAKLDEHAFKFNSTPYNCILEVTYTPETVATKPKYEYKLLSIQEVCDTQHSSIPEQEDPEKPDE